jgi:hypothetical protein
MLESAKSWVTARWEERTSWNGGALIAVGVVALVAKPILGLVAWAAIAYGAYQIWKKEGK